MNRRPSGFTLLELLVALAIFALLSVGTYRMLDAVLGSDRASAHHEQALRQLSRAMSAFERDLLQVSPRPIRDRYGEERNALLSEPGERGAGPALEFTRGGWRNPVAAARSDLLRVRWQLRDGTLERHYWTVLDRDTGSQPREQRVLDGISALAWRYLDGNGQWHDAWPPPDDQRMSPEAAAMRLPNAVEMRFEHPRYGAIRRLFRLPDGNLGSARRFEGLPEGVEP